MYFLLDLVDVLDLSAIVIPAQAKDPRGEKGFDPRMMTLLLLYAYCVGTVSSRKIERACHEDLAFRVLTCNQQPGHSRISEFRRRNLEALNGLFVQILRLCQEAGMVSLGLVALDGTKVQANASKHKAMSHERMLKAEAQLEKEIRELMRKAELLYAQEDGKYGKGELGSDLPKELQRRQDRLEAISRARKALEAEAAKLISCGVWDLGHGGRPFPPTKANAVRPRQHAMDTLLGGPVPTPDLGGPVPTPERLQADSLPR